MAASLVFGGGVFDREVNNADKLLLAYAADDGTHYLDYVPTTSSSRLFVEDLAITLVVNSQATGRAAKSLIRFGPSVDLANLPVVSLQETSPNQRRELAEFISRIAAWDGFAASTATKLLHKKRPSLIPILDNQAIFGAYLNVRWPQVRSSGDSEKRKSRIQQALDAIWFDLNRDENSDAWAALQVVAPTRTLIQLFDSIWWMYFRACEPVRRPK